MHTELIQRLKEQDRAALSQMYDMYSSALYGVVMRIVQSPELAQQVLQDTFLKVWKNSASYDSSKGRLFTWLLNIARNTAIDATRTAHFRYRQKTENIDTLVSRPGNDAMNPDHLGVREAVGALDEKYKSLIDLIYFKGYTQEEVAEETGIPIGTVKTRLRYAMNELRKVFGDTNAVAFLILAEAIRNALK
jgi:RNA polymerase sigma-70 factor (ECF subfamily)